MSPGRYAPPSILFSTAGIKTRNCTGASKCISICANASVHAAPPISFFISSMPAEGFRSSPPLSKQTPFPTRVTRGAPGSPQRMSISRGARGLPAPTA